MGAGERPPVAVELRELARELRAHPQGHVNSFVRVGELLDQVAVLDRAAGEVAARLEAGRLYGHDTALLLRWAAELENRQAFQTPALVALFLERVASRLEALDRTGGAP